MAESIYRDGTTRSRRRRAVAPFVGPPRSRERIGVGPPSPRSIQGLFQWIHDADRANRPWARNALVLLAFFATLVLLAIQLGVLPQ